MMCYVGGRLEQQSEVDSVGLSRFTIGNLNRDEDRKTSALGSAMTPLQAAKLVSATDFLYSFVFLVFVCVWRCTVFALKGRLDGEVVSCSDYSVSAPLWCIQPAAVIDQPAS